MNGALNAPFQSAFGEDIYKTVYEKAAVLFYFVAKDHAFENGNKRIAVVTLLYYLSKNDLAIRIPARKLYEIAVAVVESKKSKDQIVPRFAELIEGFCIPYDEWLQ